MTILDTKFVKDFIRMADDGFAQGWHLDPWMEIMEEHTKAGYRNYSIFQNGNQFFYCFECDDVDSANEYISKSEVCNRWNAITSKMVVGSFDFNENEPIKFMKEVFYLK